MEIRLAKTAGFCFGVNRAVQLVDRLVDEGAKVATLGPLIHNPQAVERMRSQGVLVVDRVKDVPSGYQVVVRSHGVPRSIYDEIEARGLTCQDATCPFVKKIQDIAAKAEADGAVLLVAGNADHPEVQGIKGWGKDDTLVIQSAEELEKYSLQNGEKLCVVAQTTFNYNKFKDLVEIIEKKGYDIIVLNTICNATKERQEEARKIAESVDAMIVIGDKQSSNTQKLFEICAKACNDTYYIQTLDDLNVNQLGSVETVGITAGASTPNNIIEEVQNNVRINF